LRWKTKKKPAIGEERVVWYFALWPTPLSDGNTVWLERYWSRERWEYSPSSAFGGWWREISTLRNEGGGVDLQRKAEKSSTVDQVQDT